MVNLKLQLISNQIASLKTIKSDHLKIVSNHFNVINNHFKTINIYWVNSIKIVLLYSFENLCFTYNKGVV